MFALCTSLKPMVKSKRHNGISRECSKHNKKARSVTQGDNLEGEGNQIKFKSCKDFFF